VLGQGAVTLIDGREMLSNFLDVAERERMELVNVKLHLLPSGARYYLNEKDGVPPALRDAVAAVTSVSTLANPSFPSSLERRHGAHEGSEPKASEAATP
jgi:cyanophycinase